jgi:hypothetical protein
VGRNSPEAAPKWLIGSCDLNPDILFVIALAGSWPQRYLLKPTNGGAAGR